MCNLLYTVWTGCITPGSASSTQNSFESDLCQGATLCWRDAELQNETSDVIKFIYRAYYLELCF